RSMCHMASKVQPVWGLQYFPPEEIPEMVVQTYKRLYNAYLDERSLVPEGHLHEISYEQLVDDPRETLRGAYEQLDLGGYENYQPRLEEYLAANAGYQRNKHAELPTEDCVRLHDQWSRFFTEFGYGE
ncbi:MAG: sulfotransferase, partial [Planctomycetaceae bacterium]|nr:sulfotransferase [Planctomycetaceae bacterium]